MHKHAFRMMAEVKNLRHSGRLEISTNVPVMKDFDMVNNNRFFRGRMGQDILLPSVKLSRHICFLERNIIGTC